LNEVLKTMLAGSTFPSLPSPHSSQSPFLGACCNRHYEVTNRCFGLMLYSKTSLMDTEWVIEVCALSKLNLQKMSKDYLSLGNKQTVLNNEVSILGGCP